MLGKQNVYPFYQPHTASEWFTQILASPATAGLAGTIAHELRARQMKLRCEPGRALLDGCGMTIARVAHRKRTPSGDLLVGLAMNTSQCRTGSDDFMVDPLLITTSEVNEPTAEGYLTGSYCTEAEVISLRKFRFHPVPQVGDLIAFPNTAGYFMHFRECQAPPVSAGEECVLFRHSRAGTRSD